MNALPARTTFVYATDESTHYLTDTKRIGLIDLTVRLPHCDGPHSDGPHPAVLVSYGVNGATFTEATTVARALTGAGFATVLFGRDVTGPFPPFDPLASWRRVLSWSAEHADLRTEARAVWAFGGDADDVRRLVAEPSPGLRGAVAVMPEPERTGPLRRTVRALRGARTGAPSATPRVPLMIAVSTTDLRHEQRIRALARSAPRVQWTRYRVPADEVFRRDNLALLLDDQIAFLRRHLAH